LLLLIVDVGVVGFKEINPYYFTIDGRFWMLGTPSFAY